MNGPPRSVSVTPRHDGYAAKIISARSRKRRQETQTRLCDTILSKPILSRRGAVSPLRLYLHAHDAVIGFGDAVPDRGCGLKRKIGFFERHHDAG